VRRALVYISLFLSFSYSAAAQEDLARILDVIEIETAPDGRSQIIVDSYGWTDYAEAETSFIQLQAALIIAMGPFIQEIADVEIVSEKDSDDQLFHYPKMRVVLTKDYDVKAALAKHLRKPWDSIKGLPLLIDFSRDDDSYRLIINPTASKHFEEVLAEHFDDSSAKEVLGRAELDRQAFVDLVRLVFPKLRIVFPGVEHEVKATSQKSGKAVNEVRAWFETEINFSAPPMLELSNILRFQNSLPTISSHDVCEAFLTRLGYEPDVEEGEI
jgi:hypothetical protein